MSTQDPRDLAKKLTAIISVEKGVVAGKTNKEGTWVEGEEHDIGHLFHTWFRALGIDPELVSYDNGGQPLPIAHDECAAVKEILA